MANRNEEAIVQHHGHADTLKFAIVLCLCYTLCVACLRGYTRWRAYSLDDLMVLLSGILTLTFFGVVLASISAGFGRPVTDLIVHSPDIDKLNDYAIAGNVLWITSLCVSKIAIIAMLSRLTQTILHRRAQYGVGALIVAQCLISFLLLTVNCSIHRELSWNMTSADIGCPHIERRWHALTVLDITTEVLLLLLPIQLVWNLQMAFRTKLVVISAFWLRIPTLVFSALRQNEMHKLTTTSDVSLTAATVVIWQAVELSYSLAAATLAALKRFTESLNTGFGHGELMRIHGSSQGYKLSDRSATSRNTKASRNKSPLLNEIESSIDKLSFETSIRPLSQSQTVITQIKLRPEVLRNTAVISSPPPKAISHNRRMDDSFPEDNSIRQEVQYSIHYEQSTMSSQDCK